tara:strand:- start:110 stop:628 length:519 start_codon:yes stop_codon:yes gene_type:complete
MGLMIERKWAMPSKDTYTIKPIKELLKRWVDTDYDWIDPFCGLNSPANYKNDLNPNIPDATHMDAIDFLKSIPTNSGYKGVLYDPPYSVRQVMECYKGYGINITQETTQAKWYRLLKDEITRISPEITISFGWSSGGIGKTNGYEPIEILLVPHGGIHNDTICTVERKIEIL